MKKIMGILFCALFFCSSLYADDNQDSLAAESLFVNLFTEGKMYEVQKQYCHAFGSYYDSMCTNLSADAKNEVFQAFYELKSIIQSGNPGYGTFDEFDMHDEWQKLLQETADYCNSNFFYDVNLKLKKTGLDYKTRTTNYICNVELKLNEEKIIYTTNIISEGFAVANRSDWNDIDFNFDLMFPDPNRYEITVNIVDENGTELLNSKSCYGSGNVEFPSVSSSIYSLLESGKANINLVSIKLDGKTLIPKNSFSINKAECDEKLKNFRLCLASNIDKLMMNFVSIPGLKLNVQTTEVTQEVYEVVMGENPSTFKGLKNPVENVSLYDAIDFCNKLSILKGLTPVYSVNGETNVSEWNYIPHKGKEIKGKLSLDVTASGYRLPLFYEWLYAARGGQNCKYFGSDNFDEVGWYWDNSGNKTHLVAQKKSNGYGLYDMSGNVWELVLCESSYNKGNFIGYALGQGCYNASTDSRIDVELLSPELQDCQLGFRVVCRDMNIDILNLDMIDISDKGFKISSTEVTQDLYEFIIGEIPCEHLGLSYPVENVSWYDAIYFCNKLSVLKGVTPVYTVNGISDVTKWNYVPHSGNSIIGVVSQNKNANGYRLPSAGEWFYAATDGLYYNYLGIDNLGEIAWYSENSSGYHTNPVAQKKANGFGLYDSFGNVSEWMEDSVFEDDSKRYYRGGRYKDNSGEFWSTTNLKASVQMSGLGFRIALNTEKIENNEEVAINNNVEENNYAEEKVFSSTNILDSLDFVKRFDLYILSTEVNQELYEYVMGENPSYFKGKSKPVVNVSWYDAIYFCNKLSVLKGFTPVYSVDFYTDVEKWNYTPHCSESIYGIIRENSKANGFRLPTKKEWQIVAGCYTGYTYAGSDNLDEVGWYQSNSSEVQPCGQKKANAWGVYDMSGNVWEWVLDSGILIFEDLRYMCGGSYTDRSKRCKVKATIMDFPSARYCNLGFRIVRSSN